MSVRTFSRRFKAETGQSPGAWLLQQRVRHACHLLETTDLPVDRVAARPASVRRPPCGTTCAPSSGFHRLAYRKTFRAS